MGAHSSRGITTRGARAVGRGGCRIDMLFPHAEDEARWCNRRQGPRKIEHAVGKALYRWFNRIERFFNAILFGSTSGPSMG